MTLHEFLIAPFADYAFMRRALAACAILALGGAPLGVFLTLRRMTLAGDAMSHAILPGVAVAFLAFGVAVWPMTLGGLVTGAGVAFAAAFLARRTQLREDSAFALLYLLSIAGGATLVALKSRGADLTHLLFGDILAIDRDALALVTATTCLTLGVMAVLYREMVIECFDPAFLKAAGRGGRGADTAFFVLLAVNLIAAFQALGTLMALGLMILPAIAARFWTRSIDTALPLGIALALFSSVAGLLTSWHAGLPAGPAVVLAAGGVALLSACFGSRGSLRSGLPEPF
jgi:zinc/manganese transport system permease protein